MKRLIPILLCCLLILTGCFAQAEDEGSGLALEAINVGKADCLLLYCGQDIYMIDTGTAESWGKISAALKERGIERLTGVIVTHADKDHSGGTWALAQYPVEIGAWYTSAWCADYADKKNPVLLAAALRGQEVIRLRSGDTLPMDGGKLTVLGPTQPSDKENNNSVVLLAESPDGAILLAGDMEFPEERLLLDAGLIPHCAVLKVGNHGESDATSAELIRALSPQLAVISTSTAEEPDTPAPRVLNVLAGARVQTVVTQNTAGAVRAELRMGETAACYVTYPERPAAQSGLRILSWGEDDAIVLQNETGSAIDLAGWYIVSERGGECFVFPSGASVGPGQSVRVSSLSSKRQGDYVWPEKKVWNEKKGDEALLYDIYGRRIDAK